MQSWREASGGGSMDDTSAAVAHLGSPEDMSGADLDAALAAMWNDETARVGSLLSAGDLDFKSISDLPLARIKRIMKSDEDVRMISAEAPVLFAKACELFILELTIRSWCHTTEDKASKKRALTREAVVSAVQHTDVFDFLVGILTPGAKPQYLLDVESRTGAGGGGGAGASRMGPGPAPTSMGSTIGMAPRMSGSSGMPSSSGIGTRSGGGTSMYATLPSGAGGHGSAYGHAHGHGHGHAAHAGAGGGGGGGGGAAPATVLGSLHQLPGVGATISTTGGSSSGAHHVAPGGGAGGRA